MTYSFYSSDRHPVKATRPAKTGSRHVRLKLLLVVLVLVAGFVGYHNVFAKQSTAVATVSKAAPPKMTTIPKPATPQPAAPTTPAVAAPPNQCAGNTLSTYILVSISQRHLWACQATTQVYETPVVTGIAYLAADKTPVGTYHIYAKYTDRTLRGSDSTGSWDDYVYYWMPFLQNQYGNYGLHDATWRASSDFGNIDPNSANASHGCIELPLAASKWLYDWAAVGTTVTVQA